MDRATVLRERMRKLSEVRASLRDRVLAARESGEATDVVFVHDDQGPRSDAVVSAPIRGAAEWAWRLLVIAAAVVVVALVLWNLRLIVFPIVAALLVSAVLQPAVRILRGWGLSRALAAAVVFITGLAFIVGAFTALTNLLAGQFGDISVNVQDGVDEIKGWLASGPLNLSDAEVNSYIQDATEYIQANQGMVAGGAVATATVALEILTGTLLALFTTYFFLYDGERIWAYIAKLFPRQAERPVLEAGQRAWTVLVSYVRATIVIAAVDGIGIGVLLAVTGIPLAVPLGALVFFGAFVPIVGATVTGAVAVLVALVTNGPVAAGVILLGVIAIQQLEGHILQPLIMGRMVRIHPLAVVLAVAAGVLVAGIGGAVIAVPLVAVVKTVLSYFTALQRGPFTEPPGTDRVTPSDEDPGSSTPAAAGSGAGVSATSPKGSAASP